VINKSLINEEDYMPERYPDFSQDAERLLKTGRATDAADAESKLSEQKKLLEAREASHGRLRELREKAAPSEKETRAELERRLEILKQAYERREQRLKDHYRKMIEAGVSPFSEEIHHESDRLSQIEKDFNRERGQFEQFDAEERLAAMHQLAEAVKSEDIKALKEAKRKIEDVLDEQLGTEGRGWYRRKRVYGVLLGWARGELTLLDAQRYETDEKGEQKSIPLSMEEYQGRLSKDGYLEENIIQRIAQGGCVQGKRTEDGKGFCIDCPPGEEKYEERDLRDWVLSKQVGGGW
jgi:hypothetical protein